MIDNYVRIKFGFLTSCSKDLYPLLASNCAIKLEWLVLILDGIGVVVAIAFSLLYPLVIWLLVKKFRYAQDSSRYLFAAFLLGAAVFYLAYLRKFYIMFLSGIALYGVDLVATGFIEEAVKLLILILPFIRNRLDERNGAFYGLVVGLGFGGGEAILMLSSVAASYSLIQTFLIIDLIALTSIGTLALSPIETLLFNLYIIPPLISEINTFFSVVLAPSFMGLSLGSIYERMMAILFHASTAAIIGYGLVRGKTLKYYLVAVVLHIFLNTFAILYIFGILGAIAFEAIFTVIVLALFVYILYKKVLAVD